MGKRILSGLLIGSLLMGVAPGAAAGGEMLVVRYNYNSQGEGSCTDRKSKKRETPIVLPVDTETEEEDRSEWEHYYNVPDAGETFTFVPESCDAVEDTETAVSAVEAMTAELTEEQKQSPTGIDLATLYAETASMRAASRLVPDDEITVTAASVSDLQKIAESTNAAVEAALNSNGVTTARELFNTVVLMTSSSDITVHIDPDMLSSGVDNVRIETPAYALTIRLDALDEELTETLTFQAADIGVGYAPSKTSRAAKKSGGKKAAIRVTMPKETMRNPVTISVPKESGETTNQSVVSLNGQSTASKYNPASGLMDAKVNSSGIYTVRSKQQNFSDIAEKSKEMQDAIRYLASRGIADGPDGQKGSKFNPDGSINRAEIASMLVKALGKLDSSASANFSDVSRSNWYYAAAASSQKQGYIKGFEDLTFRGGSTISKVQIISVSARVLVKEMRYKTPSTPSAYLTKYSDTVDMWAQPDVALATRENLVLYRKDGTFSGRRNMTRGDAAIIIYRLFQRLW